MASILVTGANGFIGSNLCERLAGEGHQVRGLVRATSNLQFLSGVDVELVRGDVTDRASLGPAVAGVEVVVHVAALASDWGPYQRFFAVNVEGTKNIAEASAAAGVRRLVHISTTAIHGFAGFKNASEEALRPPSRFPYAETKRLAEEWLFEFARSTALEVTAIRPGNVYGPKDHTFIEKFADALVAGKGGYVSGGQRWTCPIYIENLTDAIARACFEPTARGEAFLVTDGLDIDWRTFTERLADAIGVRRPKLSVPFSVGYGVAWLLEGMYKMVGAANPPLLTRFRICNGGRDYHFSIAKAQRLLRWTPAVGLDEAMRRTAAWYRTRGNATGPGDRVSEMGGSM